MYEHKKSVDKRWIETTLTPGSKKQVLEEFTRFLSSFDFDYIEALRIIGVASDKPHTAPARDVKGSDQ